ncbi:MAG: Spy/CpxP family protein refolding chaperone [Opitutaceae bacterium]|jgi:Spy/CpxP family protein refolding chaperone
MKSTRKYLLAVCALAIGFAAPAIYAEEGAPPRPKKEMRGSPVERILGLKEKLGLTEAQVAQLKKIGEETRAAMKALRDKEGDRDSKKDDVKKIQDDAKAKVDAVLTAEQKAKLEALKKEHGDKKGPPPAQ